VLTLICAFEAPLCSGGTRPPALAPKGGGSVVVVLLAVAVDALVVGPVPSPRPMR